MRHPSTQRPHARDFIPIAGLALVALMGGCGREQEQQQAAATAGGGACQPPGGQVTAQSRADLVAWAGGVRYRAPDAARAYVYGFAPGDSARIEAAEDASGASCVVARLTSSNAYPSRGIGAGVNYVVVDSGSTGYRAMVISADTAVGMRAFPAVMHLHEEGGSPPPTIGSMGGCVNDCGAGTVKRWCRWALDSIAAATLARPQDLRLVRSPGRPDPIVE